MTDVHRVLYRNGPEAVDLLYVYIISYVRLLSMTKFRTGDLPRTFELNSHPKCFPSSAGSVSSALGRNRNSALGNHHKRQYRYNDNRYINFIAHDDWMCARYTFRTCLYIGPTPQQPIRRVGRTWCVYRSRQK